jgi:hypothetical protein
MDKKISLLLCMCCGGNMCQANPEKEFIDLQNQIKGKVNPRQKGQLLIQMGNKARGWLEQMEGPVKSALTNVFTKVPDEDNQVTIILNTLFILAYPEDCLGITKRIEEIQDIPGVSNVDVGNLLKGVKAYLKLGDDSDSPIAELCNRYN